MNKSATKKGEHNMKIIRIFASIFMCLFMTVSAYSKEYNKEAGNSIPEDNSRLLVVWTSGDKDVAQNMVFMYTINAKKQGWWENIRFLIWGASSKLLSEDKDLQEGIQKMKELGIELYACKACADIYGVGQQLQKLGITVKYTGEDLTNWVKGGWTTLTF
jgi:hypothetical protein